MENSKDYNYPIKNMLIKDVSLLCDIVNYYSIKLCAYSINTHGKYPFLRYILNNNGFNKLILPKLPIFNSFTKYNLENYSKVFLTGILQVYEFEEFNENIDFNGFYEFEQELYLFFDITKCNINMDETYLSSQTRLALIDEIINQKHICNIPINEEIIDFFTKNVFISYLYDKNNQPYEIPVVGYVGKSTEEKLNFVYMFGESAKNKSAILGPYFYFTDFYNSIRQGGWSHNYKPEYIYEKLITDNEFGRYNKGGIVRFALFVGNTKYMENMPNDPNDESEIKKERIYDPSLDKKYEILTLRVSDHDGLWSKTYNSVYLGNIELDDGSFFDEPVLVLKEYNQQIPLSCHFIDKNKLDVRFVLNSNKYNYSIV